MWLLYIPAYSTAGLDQKAGGPFCPAGRLTPLSPTIKSTGEARYNWRVVPAGGDNGWKPRARRYWAGSGAAVSRVQAARAQSDRPGRRHQNNWDAFYVSPCSATEEHLPRRHRELAEGAPDGARPPNGEAPQGHREFRRVDDAFGGTMARAANQHGFMVGPMSCFWSVWATLTADLLGDATESRRCIFNVPAINYWCDRTLWIFQYRSTECSPVWHPHFLWNIVWKDNPTLGWHKIYFLISEWGLFCLVRKPLCQNFRFRIDPLSN